MNEISPLFRWIDGWAELKLNRSHTFSSTVPLRPDLAPSSCQTDSQSIHTFREGWERLRKINSLPPSGIEAGTFAAWICWSIWLSRNQLIFQNRTFTPAETIQKALTDAREWKLAQPSPNITPSTPSVRTVINPRRSDQISISTDAAWNSTTSEAGLGWIIEDGDSTSQHSAISTSVASPLMAETLAVLTAMNFALSHGIDVIAVLWLSGTHQLDQDEEYEAWDLWST